MPSDAALAAAANSCKIAAERRCGKGTADIFGPQISFPKSTSEARPPFGVESTLRPQKQNKMNPSQKRSLHLPKSCLVSTLRLVDLGKARRLALDIMQAVNLDSPCLLQEAVFPFLLE